MSATAVCETTVTLHKQHTNDHHSPQPTSERYLWPSFSSLRASSSKSRSTSLRVVSSESTPTPVEKPAASRTEPAAPGPGTVPVRASPDCPSLHASASATAAGPVRDQARPPVAELPAIKTAKAHHLHHVRARSATAIGEPSLIYLDSPSTRTTPRPRASSSATMGTQPRPRPRLPSMLSSVLTNPKAPVQTRIASPSHSDLVGSFAPTSSPRERLLSLFSPGATPSRTLPGPRSTRHASLRLPADRVPREHLAPVRRKQQTASSPIDSPPSPALPSICRTPSSYTGSEYFSTAPSSAGPATPVHTMTPLPPPMLARKAETSSLHPVLEGLERASMFAVRTACASCGRNGSNFPCCPRCGEMWCSRGCRLQKGNGKRHICASRGK
ncbi:hypothetical protein C2E23DRAFT_817487 [Lenzites betulinus]|nr:hypothetical protein C2E23DRAFT_817487 [Lenzites betulinus]